MYLFKLNFSSYISKLNSSFRNASDTKRKYMNPKPVPMAYASYESTNSFAFNEHNRIPLIILHGLFGSKGNWRSMCNKILEGTEPKRKIFACDIRNHGDSPHVMGHTMDDISLDIRYFMKQHNIHKSCLLGHSMGGRASMYFALKHPELIEKLIVVDILPTNTGNTGRTIYHTILKMLNILQSVHFGSEITMSKIRRNTDLQLSRYIHDKAVRTFLLTNLVRKDDGSHGWRMNIPALMADYHKMLDLSNVNNLSYNGPALFIKGRLSYFPSETDLNDIKFLFPNLKLVEMDGVSHWLYAEQPDIFLKTIMEFINK